MADGIIHEGKVCSKCRVWRPRDKFYAVGGRPFSMRPRCKECEKAQAARYMIANRDAVLEKKRKTYRSERGQESHKVYYLRNRERIRAVQKEYEKSTYAARNLRRKLRRQGDEMYRMSERVRARIRCAVNRRGYTKRTLTSTTLGCEWPEFCAYMESKFVDGMSWENSGEWHVDHMVPLASAQSEEELIALCHFTNLQPLWAAENLRKGATMPADRTE